MTSQINEQLSAYLDGELPQDELPLLLRQLEKQPNLLAEAQRLQQAHLCLLGEQPVQPLSVATDFCQNIHAAIYSDSTEFETSSNSIQDKEDYPVFDFTQPIPIDTLSNDAGNVAVARAAYANVDQTGSGTVGQTQIAASAVNDSAWKPWLGAGIAAAVAMLAVNVWQQGSVNSVPELSNQTAQTNIVEVAPVISADASNDANSNINNENSYVVPAPSSNTSTLSFVQPGDVQVVNYSPYVQRHVSSANTSAGNQLQRYSLMMQELREDEQRAKELIQQEKNELLIDGTSNQDNQ